MSNNHWKNMAILRGVFTFYLMWQGFIIINTCLSQDELALADIFVVKNMVSNCKYLPFFHRVTIVVRTLRHGLVLKYLLNCNNAVYLPYIWSGMDDEVIWNTQNNTFLLPYTKIYALVNLSESVGGINVTIKSKFRYHSVQF